MKTLATLLISMSLISTPLGLTACDRTVSHEESTKTDDNGTTVHKDTTVQKDNNGNTIKTDTKTVDKP